MILITGCSGAGKSTLLEALAQSGHSVMREPGRRIVAEERAGSGVALPWRDPVAFARRALAMAQADRVAAAKLAAPVFFDRGIVDAATALRHLTGAPLIGTHGPTRAYADRVFLAEPWPDLFARDDDRRHDLSDAIAEFERINVALADLGYRPVPLPRAPVPERLAFVMASLKDAGFPS